MIFNLALPTPPVYNYTFQAELDAVTYTLNLFWNVRDGGWYLTIGAADGTPILGSQRVVVNYPIGWEQRYNTAMPAGSIQFVDTSGQGLDPALDGSDLGSRVVMVYFDLAELIAQAEGTGTNVSG